MFETYKKSGNFSPVFLVFLALAATFSVGLAYVYQLGLHYIPLIYANLLLTLGAGFALGVSIEKVIKRGKIRNVAIAFLSLLLLVASFIGAKFGFQYLRARGEIAMISGAEISQQLGERLSDEQVNEFRQIILQNYSFKDHIEHRVENGWQIGKAGRQGGGDVSGVMVYIVWLIELGTILFISGGMAFSSVNQPFSEKLNRWADENEVVMTLPITDEAMIQKITSATTVQELLELPLPKSDESTRFAVYTVNSIPGQEMEDAYLSVELQTRTVNKKGENEVKKQSLVSHAILTSAQRAQLRDNAQSLRDAFQAYRDSLGDATTSE